MTKKDTTPKYEWEKLKTLFILGDYKTVSDFLRRELGMKMPMTGNVQRATKGWRGDKEAYVKEQEEMLRKQMGQQTVEEMIKTRNMYVNEVRRRAEESLDKLSYKELRSNWEIIKTELGEVVRITKEKIQDVDDESEEEIYNRVMKRHENTPKTSTRKGSKKRQRKPKPNGKAVAKG